MFQRHGWLLVWAACLGCQGVPVVVEPPEEDHAANQLWQQGQAAMKSGEPQRAIGFYEQSLKTDPSLTRNHVSLAAAFLECGDEASACVHLGRYVAAHPEHVQVRAQYAELLLRLHRPNAARTELTRLDADVQELGKGSVGQLITCHTRLLEIAEEQDDDFAAHLHRGIGLYHLARGRAGVADPDDELPVQGLLCKAVSELTESRRLRPDDARPCWYLYLIWTQLGQEHPARRWLREAEKAAPFSDLTPAEQRGLLLASRVRERE
jgi:tetratricopeptide (TPR) repeat protein